MKKFKEINPIILISIAIVITMTCVIFIIVDQASNHNAGYSENRIKVEIETYLTINKITGLSVDEVYAAAEEEGTVDKIMDGELSISVLFDTEGRSNKSNNLIRERDIRTIAEAIEEYLLERKILPVIPECNSLDHFIGEASSEIDLETFLIPAYIEHLPVDPVIGEHTTSTGYTICSSSGNIIISAPYATTIDPLSRIVTN